MTRALRVLSLCGLLCLVACLALTATSASETDSGNWLETILENIRRSEYEFSAVADGVWTAPSRSQGLRSVVSAEGLQLAPWLREGQAWQVDLQVVGFGRGETLGEPGPVRRIVGGGHRVELQRERLTEWYVNLPQGLEQGFVLRERPAGRADEPIVLDMLVGWGALVDLAGDGQEVLFRTESGDPLLRYDKLVVLDAQGRKLPSWLEAAAGHLRIVVQDGGAIYPLQVDPLMTTPDWSSESNQAGSRYGEEVASAGDVNDDGYDDIIVGGEDFNNEGRAFV